MTICPLNLVLNEEKVPQKNDLLGKNWQKLQEDPWRRDVEEIKITEYATTKQRNIDLNVKTVEKMEEIFWCTR